jgi:hypothetical protein
LGEVKGNIEMYEQKPDDFLDQDIKEKEHLNDLLQIDNRRVNHLAGNMELLKVLRRNNSNSNNLTIKTSQLDISNILESSLSKSILGETFTNKKKQKKGPVYLRKK